MACHAPETEARQEWNCREEAEVRAGWARKEGNVVKTAMMTEFAAGCGCTPGSDRPLWVEMETPVRRILGWSRRGRVADSSRFKIF